MSGLASRAIPMFTDADLEEEKEFNVRALMTKNLERNELVDRDGRISPSSGSCFCPRQAFFTGIKPNWSNWKATAELYAKMGNTLEDLVYEGLSNWGVAQNIRLWENEDLKLGAAADILARDFNDRLLMLEVKSCTEIPKEPKIYQLWQLMCYIAYYKIDGMMVYVSRGVMDKDQKLKVHQFNIPYNFEDAKTAIINAYISRRAIDAKLIPPRGSVIKKVSDCGFCGFTDYCWKSGASEFHEMSVTQYLEILSDADDYAEDFLRDDFVRARREDMWNKIKESPQCNFTENDYHKMFRVTC